MDLLLAELRLDFFKLIMNRKLTKYEVTYRPMRPGVLNMYIYSYLYCDVTQVTIIVHNPPKNYFEVFLIKR